MFAVKKPFNWFCVFITAVILVFAFLFIRAPKDFVNTIDEMVDGEQVVKDIRNYELNMTSIVYAENSSGEWVEYQRLHGEENRIWVDIENIPQKLIDAFIAIEDQRFYEHNGVDWKRTGSAFLNYLPFVNIYDSDQGGSTITQQLIKNITDDRDKDASRKLREIGRAIIVENKLTKREILEAYLNTISLGNGICGVQVAANYYFNKDVSELTYAECASIASITKNPSKYNPDTNPENNRSRRKYVLDKMLELGTIKQSDYETAVKSDVTVNNEQQKSFELPINNYFIDALIGEVSEDLAAAQSISVETATRRLYNGGYKIYATVDSDIQEKMENVYKQVDTYFPLKSRTDRETTMQAAMTILDYEGNIKGVVGGVGEKTVNRGLNRAMESPRQPGSTMKPLGVYALAIDRGIVAYSSVVKDKPVPNYYGGGREGPREWYGEYEGRITLRRAISHSANTIPVQLISKIGLEESYAFLKNDLNLSYLTDVDINPASLAIGGCQYGITTTQSAAAYAIFGNHGVYYEPKTYVKVLDAEDNVILSRKSGKQVLKPESADIMNKLLQGVIYDPGGTGYMLSRYSNMRAYAKTGTSSEANDSWVVGGTPYYVGSVWCGFDKPENMWNTSYSAVVWKAVMSAVHEELETKQFEMSEDIPMARFCTFSGLRAGSSCENTEWGYCVPDVYYKYCDGVHIDEDEEKEKEEKAKAEKEKAEKEKANSSKAKTSSDTSSGTGSDNSSDASSGQNDSSDTSSGTSSDTSSGGTSPDDTSHN